MFAPVASEQQTRKTNPQNISTSHFAKSFFALIALNKQYCIEFKVKIWYNLSTTIIGGTNATPTVC